MFSTFSLLVYIKCFLKKMSVNATDMTYPKSAPEKNTILTWIANSTKVIEAYESSQTNPVEKN